MSFRSTGRAGCRFWHTDITPAELAEFGHDNKENVQLLCKLYDSACVNYMQLDYPDETVHCSRQWEARSAFPKSTNGTQELIYNFDYSAWMRKYAPQVLANKRYLSKAMFIHFAVKLRSSQVADKIEVSGAKIKKALATLDIDVTRDVAFSNVQRRLKSDVVKFWLNAAEHLRCDSMSVAACMWPLCEYVCHAEYEDQLVSSGSDYDNVFGNPHKHLTAIDYEMLPPSFLRYDQSAVVAHVRKALASKKRKLPSPQEIGIDTETIDPTEPTPQFHAEYAARDQVSIFGSRHQIRAAMKRTICLVPGVSVKIPSPLALGNFPIYGFLATAATLSKDKSKPTTTSLWLQKESSVTMAFGCEFPPTNYKWRINSCKDGAVVELAWSSDTMHIKLLEVITSDNADATELRVEYLPLDSKQAQLLNRGDQCGAVVVPNVSHGDLLCICWRNKSHTILFSLTPPQAEVWPEFGATFLAKRPWIRTVDNDTQPSQGYCNTSSCNTTPADWEAMQASTQESQQHFMCN